MLFKRSADKDPGDINKTLTHLEVKTIDEETTTIANLIKSKKVTVVVNVASK